MPAAEILSAPLVLEYPFSRTVGPVQSAFLTGLREGVVLGVRAVDGRVLCPPAEYDPTTSDELTDLVELGETGTVATWSWEPEPRPNQPLDRPFAWALIRLDGADTGLLHAVDAGSPERMASGMPVRIRWNDQRVGSITDIACFEPVEAP
jgi:hypothetical protein